MEESFKGDYNHPSDQEIVTTKPDIQKYLDFPLEELVNKEEQEGSAELSPRTVKEILDAARSLSDGELDIFIQEYEAVHPKTETAQIMSADEIRLASLYQEREKRQNVERSIEGSETIEQIRENMWLLRKEGSSNPVSVVFRQGEQLYITDPGISWKSKDKNRRIQELEQSLGARVTGVFLTHSHPDHIGNIPNIGGKNIPVYAHKKAFWSLHAPHKLLKAENILARQGGAQSLFPDWQAEHVYPPYARWMYGKGAKGLKKGTEAGGQYREFQEGPRRFDGYTVEVVDTPGHTRGEVSFWIPEEKILISGDLIPNTHLGRDHIASLYMPEANIYEAINSLKKIKGLAPRMIIPAHGEPIRSAAEIEDRIEKMIVVLESFITAVHDLKKDNPEMSVEQMAEKVFSGEEYPKASFGRIERKTIVASVLRDKQ